MMYGIVQANLNLECKLVCIHGLCTSKCIVQVNLDMTDSMDQENWSVICKICRIRMTKT